MTTDLAPLQERLYLGEASAFVELYDLLGEKLYRYLVSMVKSHDDAIELVQETFVQLVKFHRRLRNVDNLNGHVFAVARNEMIRWLNRINKTRTKINTTIDIHDLVDDRDSKPDSETESKDWLHVTLKCLAPIDREIVQLKVFSLLTFEEIATVTGLKHSNVATRYQRAIAKLENHLASSSTEGNENHEQH